MGSGGRPSSRPFDLSFFDLPSPMQDVRFNPSRGLRLTPLLLPGDQFPLPSGSSPYDFVRYRTHDLPRSSLISSPDPRDAILQSHLNQGFRYHPLTASVFWLFFCCLFRAFSRWIHGVFSGRSLLVLASRLRRSHMGVGVALACED